MIASAEANTGFGIKAAASQFGLTFIPVIKETYILAVNKQIPANVKSLLRKHLSSVEFKTTANAYLGYDATNARRKLGLEQLFTNQAMNAFE